MSILDLSSDEDPLKTRPKVFAISMTSSVDIMLIFGSLMGEGFMGFALLDRSFNFFFFSSFLRLFSTWIDLKWAGIVFSNPGGKRGPEQEDPFVSEEEF